jgi:hypothetical protein
MKDLVAAVLSFAFGVDGAASRESESMLERTDLDGVKTEGLGLDGGDTGDSFALTECASERIDFVRACSLSFCSSTLCEIWWTR